MFSRYVRFLLRKPLPAPNVFPLCVVVRHGVFAESSVSDTSKSGYSSISYLLVAVKYVSSVNPKTDGEHYSCTSWYCFALDLGVQRTHR